MMLPLSSPSSRTTKTHGARTLAQNGGLGCVLRSFSAGKKKKERKKGRRRKVTYPEDEGVDDEEGFEAGDDRFSFHGGASAGAVLILTEPSVCGVSRCSHALMQPHSVTGAAHHTQRALWWAAPQPVRRGKTWWSPLHCSPCAYFIFIALSVWRG